LKKFVWILALCLVVTGKVYAQEEGDDFFEEDEPPAESDFDYQPPQVPGANPSENNGAGGSPRFSRPNFPNDSSRPSQPVGMNSDGSFEFKLVDPPQFKPKRKKWVVPPGVRAKVEQNLKESDKIKGDDK
jgi:hypothetical protein